METYPLEIEEGMRRLYHSLNEKDRRRFAGWEALRFGPGRRNYIARVLGCSRNTVGKGAREVSDPKLVQAEDSARKRNVDLREVVHAIFYRFRTGCHWQMLPKEFPD